MVVANKTHNNTFEYDLPVYSSPEGRKVKVVFTTGFKKFMSYSNNTLTVKPGDDDDGNYVMTMKLIDDKGQYQVYFLHIAVIKAV